MSVSVLSARTGMFLEEMTTCSSLIETVSTSTSARLKISTTPKALGKAGVITNKKVTSYPGEEIESYLKAGKYVEEEVVVDGHIITSRGPATAFAFAYKLLDVLGIDSSSLKHGMLYDLYR